MVTRSGSSVVYCVWLSVSITWPEVEGLDGASDAALVAVVVCCAPAPDVDDNPHPASATINIAQPSSASRCNAIPCFSVEFRITEILLSAECCHTACTCEQAKHHSM